MEMRALSILELQVIQTYGFLLVIDCNKIKKTVLIVGTKERYNDLKHQMSSVCNEKIVYLSYGVEKIQFAIIRRFVLSLSWPFAPRPVAHRTEKVCGSLTLERDASA
jgi:hypothetical protein